VRVSFLVRQSGSPEKAVENQYFIFFGEPGELQINNGVWKKEKDLPFQVQDRRVRFFSSDGNHLCPDVRLVRQAIKNRLNSLRLYMLLWRTRDSFPVRPGSHPVECSLRRISACRPASVVRTQAQNPTAFACTAVTIFFPTFYR
jgi:hypothetical protein